MDKIVDIRKYTRKHPKQSNRAGGSAEGDDLPDIDDDVCWNDPPSAEETDDMADLPLKRIAAIVVKGCFALYHLVREHKRRRTHVPSYLLDYARAHEEPLIPAAETVYEAYFQRGGDPDEIPDDLLDLGLGTADDVTACTPYALRLYQLLSALDHAGPLVLRRKFRHMTAPDGTLPFLLETLLACYQWREESRQRMKPV